VKTFLASLSGGIVGLIAAYFCGVYVGCWLHPTSNLCGIYGVFVAPVGLLAGATCGWLIARRRRPKP
jgi:hypothetical protein